MVGAGTSGAVPAPTGRATIYNRIDVIKPPADTLDPDMENFYYLPNPNALNYFRKIMVMKYTSQWRITNNANTAAYLEMMLLKPRFNFGTLESIASCMRTSLLDLGMINDAEIAQYLANPINNLAPCYVLWRFWQRYKKWRHRVNPGKTVTITIRTKIPTLLNAADVYTQQFMKGFTRGLIVRAMGADNVNDKNLHVGWCDYNLAIMKREEFVWKNLPMQTRYLARNVRQEELIGDIQVINPISGQMEEEYDTATGWPSSVPSGTGYPVVVSNPLTDPVPVITPPTTSKAKVSFKANPKPAARAPKDLISKPASPTAARASPKLPLTQTLKPYPKPNPNPNPNPKPMTEEEIPSTQPYEWDEDFEMHEE